MNIFANPNEFLGEVLPDSFGRSLTDFFNVVAGIRETLGDSQSLLTDYLETVLDAISKTNIETSATLGVSIWMKELRTVCSEIICGKSQNPNHLFSQTAKRY